MNKKVKGGIIAVCLAILSILGYQGVQTFGGNYQSVVQTVGGTLDNAILLPNTYVEANTTTTVAIDDGGAWNQLIRTEGIETVRLSFSGIGSVSTSTVEVKQMSSFDGTNYFDVNFATTSLQAIGRDNGINAITPLTYETSFTPGTATTSWTYDYDVAGAKYTRFLVKSNNTGDLNIGAQAWITAVLIDKSR